MTRDEIQQEMLQIIGDQLCQPIEAIDDETTFTSLGADSLDIVEMIMHVEEKYDIQIEDKETEECKTFSEFVDLVTRKVGEGK
jgi:acyl carrier protein